MAHSKGYRLGIEGPSRLEWRPSRALSASLAPGNNRSGTHRDSPDKSQPPASPNSRPFFPRSARGSSSRISDACRRSLRVPCSGPTRRTAVALPCPDRRAPPCDRTRIRSARSLRRSHPDALCRAGDRGCQAPATVARPGHCGSGRPAGRARVPGPRKPAVPLPTSWR